MKTPSHILSAIIPLAAAIALLATACTATRKDTETAGEPCPLHGVVMEKADLPVIYGLPSQAEFEEMKVAKELFPYGRPCRMGGCVLKEKKETSGFLCPKCVAARGEWLKQRASQKD
jgi:hypothetical protein